MTEEERAELVLLVERIIAVDFDSEEAVDAALADFESRVPHPRASGLIYHWHLELDHEPTPGEIVDLALSYRPIEL